MTNFATDPKGSRVGDGGSPYATGDQASVSDSTQTASKSSVGSKNKKDAPDVKCDSNTKMDALAKLFSVIDIKVERSEEFERLLQLGFDPEVAAKMDAMYQTGTLMLFFSFIFYQLICIV
jgi:hypothetical protein